MGTDKTSERTILKGYVNDLQHVQDQVGLTDWERDFIEKMKVLNFLENLSPKQKDVILKLAEKYL